MALLPTSSPTLLSVIDWLAASEGDAPKVTFHTLERLLTAPTALTVAFVPNTAELKLLAEILTQSLNVICTTSPWPKPAGELSLRSRMPVISATVVSSFTDLGAL